MSGRVGGVWSRARTLLALLRLLLLLALACAGLILIVDGLHRLNSAALDRLSNARPPPAFRLPDPGINLELIDSSPAEQRAALARLKEHGIGWVRQRVAWAEIEPMRGVYRWERLDGLLAEIDRNGLAVMIVLDGSPAWARAAADLPPHDAPYGPPADSADLARFAQDLAERYRGQIDAYQIWDEPNIAPHWGNRHINPVHYVQMLTATAAAIRTADPEARIVAGALAPTTDRGHTAVDEVYFLERMIAAGALPQIDAVAVQPYGFGDRAADLRMRGGELNFGRLLAVRRALVAMGAADIPLVAARFGWNRQPRTPFLAVSADEQRRFATDAASLARSWPWLVGLAWAIDQPDRPPGHPLWGFAATDALLDALHPDSEAQERETGAGSEGLASLLLGLGVVGLSIYRGHAAWQTVPAQMLTDGYRRAPWLVQAALWLSLLTLYHLSTWPPLLLAWLGLAAVLIAANPVHGLMVILVALPLHIFHKEIEVAGQLAHVPPAHALLLATVPAWMLDWRRAPAQRVRPLLFDLLALSWLLISWGAVVNVWHWPAFWRGWVDLVLAPLLLYGFMRHWLVDRPALLRAAAALAGGGALVALLGLSGWLTGSGTTVDGVRRLVGPHFSPNHTALYLERTLFLMLGLTATARLTRNGAGRYAGIAGIALCAAGLILTFSRGALLLALPVGTGVFALLTGREFVRPWRRAAVGFGIAAGVAVAVSLVLAWPRLTNSATVLERLALWRVSLELMSATLPAGTGPTGFYHHFAALLTAEMQIDPNLRHPHNLWLETAISTGIAGLLWLAVYLAALVAWGRRIAVAPKGASATWIAAGALAGLAAGLSHGMVDAYQALPDLAAWNWAAIAILVATAGEQAPSPVERPRRA